MLLNKLLNLLVNILEDPRRFTRLQNVIVPKGPKAFQSAIWTVNASWIRCLAILKGLRGSKGMQSEPKRSKWNQKDARGLKGCKPNQKLAKACKRMQVEPKVCKGNQKEPIQKNGILSFWNRSILWTPYPFILMRSPVGLDESRTSCLTNNGQKPNQIIANALSRRM